MEEDSEKRRERLKAMRAEAAAAESTSAVPPTAGGGGGLANPLLETAPPQGDHQSLGGTFSRFDFYTDPLAMYSGHKRPAATSAAYPGPRNFGMAPISSHQIQSNYSQNFGMAPISSHQIQSNYSHVHGMNQAQGVYHSGVPYNSPRGLGRPYSMYQGNPPEVWGGTHYSPATQTGMNSPYPVHQVSPNLSHGRGRTDWTDSSSYPGSGRGVSHNPSSGRGQGRWQGSGRGPVFGRGSGRGRGFGSHASASDERRGSEKFYDSSMVEDPWQNLQPVVWKGSGAPSSWLPDSITMKKPRVSEPSNKSTSQPSLAEYLAATMNEVANDSPSLSHD